MHLHTQQAKKSRRQLQRDIDGLVAMAESFRAEAARGREAMRLLAAVVRRFGEPVGEGTQRAVTLTAADQDMSRSARVASEIQQGDMSCQLVYTE